MLPKFKKNDYFMSLCVDLSMGSGKGGSAGAIWVTDVDCFYCSDEFTCSWVVDEPNVVESSAKGFDDCICNWDVVGILEPSCFCQIDSYQNVRIKRFVKFHKSTTGDNDTPLSIALEQIVGIKA